MSIETRLNGIGRKLELPPEEMLDEATCASGSPATAGMENASAFTGGGSDAQASIPKATTPSMTASAKRSHGAGPAFGSPGFFLIAASHRLVEAWQLSFGIRYLRKLGNAFEDDRTDGRIASPRHEGQGRSPTLVAVIAATR